MTTKVSTTMKGLFDRIAGNDQAIENAQRENEELRRQAAWARGQERRDRLKAVGAEATGLADGAADTATAIDAALNDVTAAVRRVHQLGADYNGALADLQRKIAAERVAPRHDDRVPPSPGDGGVASIDNGIQVGNQRIHTTAPAALIQQAVQDGQNPDGTSSGELRLTSMAPPLAGRFWRVQSNGRVLVADNDPGNDCVEVTRAEFLSSAWRIDLRDLPQEVLDELSDRDRARLAREFLPGDAA